MLAVSSGDLQEHHRKQPVQRLSSTHTVASSESERDRVRLQPGVHIHTRPPQVPLYIGSGIRRVCVMSPSFIQNRGGSRCLHGVSGMPSRPVSERVRRTVGGGVCGVRGRQIQDVDWVARVSRVFRQCAGTGGQRG